METKLDKLEKEGGRIIRPNKNTQYIVKKGKQSKLVIFKTIIARQIQRKKICEQSKIFEQFWIFKLIFKAD